MNMKKIVIFMLVIAMISCTQKDDKESIKKQISELESTVLKANKQIEELKKKLPVDAESQVAEHSVSVKLQTVNSRHFEHYFEANGIVEAENDAFISPEMNGQILKIYVKEGDQVRKGKVLLKLNTKLIDSSIEEVKTGLDLATNIFEKQQKLWNQGIGTEIQYLKSKNAKESLEKKLVTLRAQMSMSVIKAPFTGIVDKIFLKKGEMAAPGMQVIQMVDLSKMYITADISENYISKIKVGDSVSISFPSYPDLQMNVPVHRISNTIKIQNRTFQIKLKVENPERLLKPNILTILKIKDYSTDSALVVPSIIMKQDNNGFFIFKANTSNSLLTAEKVYIKPGISYKSYSTIKEGLKEGDNVIVEGYNMVSNGSFLKEKK